MSAPGGFLLVTVLAPRGIFYLSSYSSGAWKNCFCWFTVFCARGFVMSAPCCPNKDTFVAALCVSTFQPIIMGSGKACGVGREPWRNLLLNCVSPWSSRWSSRVRCCGCSAAVAVLRESIGQGCFHWSRTMVWRMKTLTVIVLTASHADCSLAVVSFMTPSSKTSSDWRLGSKNAETCGRGASTHGNVLNGHMEASWIYTRVFSACHTQHTTQTPHHIYTHHHIHTTNTGKESDKTLSWFYGWWCIISANGEVQTNEEATVYVKDLDLFVTVQFLEYTLADLSLFQPCQDHGYSCEWTGGRKPHLIKSGRRIPCNTEIDVPIVCPGVSSGLRVPVQHCRLFHLHYRSQHEKLLRRDQRKEELNRNQA